MSKTLTIAIGAIVFASLANAQPLKSPISSVTLRRDACFGACPIYEVTISNDGRVEYKGSAFVRIRGTRKNTVSVDEFERLVKKVEEIGFFDLKDAYRGNVTDLPHTFVTVRRGSVSKTIDDYINAPKGLHELEQLIDQTAKTSQWVKLDQKAANREWERAIRRR